MRYIDEVRYDLSLKNGSLSGAMISFFISIGIFVIAPYAIFAFASGSFEGTTVFGDKGDLADGVWGWIIEMIRYAFPLVLLSIPIGFYRAGSFARIPFKILFALYLGSWLWIAAHGGIFSFTLSEGGTLTTISLDVRYVAYVMIMICIAMVFLAFSEFGGNRKKYLEALEKKKDTMSRRRARRLSG